MSDLFPNMTFDKLLAAYDEATEKLYLYRAALPVHVSRHGFDAVNAKKAKLEKARAAARQELIDFIKS